MMSARCLKTDKLNNIINRFLNNNDYKLFIKFGPFMFSWFNKYKKYINNHFIIQLILSIFIFQYFRKGYLEYTIINVL